MGSIVNVLEESRDLAPLKSRLCSKGNCTFPARNGHVRCNRHSKCRASSCAGITISGFKYCSSHVCQHSDCGHRALPEYGFVYCPDHTCFASNCTEKRRKSGRQMYMYCDSHKCSRSGCEELAESKSRWSDFCATHQPRIENKPTRVVPVLVPKSPHNHDYAPTLVDEAIDRYMNPLQCERIVR